MESTVKAVNGCIFEIMDYRSDGFSEYWIEDKDGVDFEVLKNIPESTTRWINIDGGCPQSTLECLSKTFRIHPLVTEDIANNVQRAKIEDYDDYLYIVSKMIYYMEDELIIEHISFILGWNYVISFGELKGDVFTSIRDRIRNQNTLIRKSGADYLMYSLLDAIVDGYFEVLEVLGERIDKVEEDVLQVSSTETLHEIREVKNSLMYIHKYIWPLREVTSWMGKDSTELIRPATELYIRDVYDHIIQIIDTTETYRELLAGLIDLNLSSVSFRLNEVMKVLTIISTLFIPLTFIAGVYGMNFRYMPEIDWKYGYYATWVIMVVIAVSMIIFFKKKKWF
ncbi:magnesium/cobalt transporter CorA [Youngiibacter fragilis]|uniref:Magnesium transport protein CorA n=1 Tax=Youngiibacter fragilis 232.1 TaxID=994573 RepID=V7I115_9CLOT|nr:magnesium/cobalt transporter CorA [Youngiibacter fragilis]ETA79553.1 magnesium transporter [Youngiibacter fragilis 232.1]